MNKLLVITSSLLAAGTALGEFTAPTLNVDAKIGFDTADVSEGRRTGDQLFTPKAEIGIPLLDNAGELYFGIDASLKSNSRKSSTNEIAPYIGFSYDITDMFTIDLGYTYHRIPEGKPVVTSIVGVPFVVLNDQGVPLSNRGGSGGTIDVIQGNLQQLVTDQHAANEAAREVIEDNESWSSRLGRVE
ncbi:MAG: hypothetical protein LBS71_01990, partial [Puniceicoccales bacterium]|nr:hypothetical protein [Puniceicoccales bacterium]